VTALLKRRAAAALPRRPLQRLPLSTKAPAAPDSGQADNAALGDRLAAAEKLLSPAWFAAAVTDLYTTKPRPVPELVTDLLKGPLHVGEAASKDSGIGDAALKKRADVLLGKVRAGVPGGLNAAMAAIGADLPKRKAELDPLVSDRLGARTWAFGDLLLDLWDKWLQCTPRPDALKSAGVATDKVVDGLRSMVEDSVKAYATNHFGASQLAALAPARGALKSKLEPLDHWVTAAAELDGLTDAVMADLKIPFKDHADKAWVDVRAKMTDVVVVAEVDLIKDHKLVPLGGFDEPIWAKARPMYASTMTKPIWKFYDDVVDFKILGASVGKAGGVHSAVKPALERVEQSAARLGGPAYSSFKATDVGGFRFEPAKGDFAHKAHVSLHATARAIDFDAAHNPFASGATKDIVTIIGGVDMDLAGGIPGFDELGKLAEALDAIQARAKGLRAKLKGDLSDADKAETEQLLADAEKELANLPTRPDVQSARDRAGKVYDSLVKAQTEFLKLWQAATKGTGKAKDLDPADLVKRLNDFRDKRLEPIDKQIEEANKKLEELKQDGTGTSAEAAKKSVNEATAKIKALQAQKARKAKEIDDLTAKVEKKDQKSLSSLEAVFSAGGLTNLPKWMVQAFIENGFTWGGGWHDPVDAMHFSYMAPIPGVSQPSMG